MQAASDGPKIAAIPTLYAMRGSIALIHCLGRVRLASHGKRLVATVAEALADG